MATGFRWAFAAAVALASPLALIAQSPCDNTPSYSSCDLPFELTPADSAAHPDPYSTVNLIAELRGPSMHTYGIPAFWDGGRRMVLRFTPTEPGRWEYRLTSNIAAWNGQSGAFTAAASEAPGFVRVANLHHFAYTERNLPHLWMAVTEMRMAFVNDDEFRAMADAHRAEKFNHLRGLVLGDAPDRALNSTGEPFPEQFQRLDQRVRYWNQKGGIVDLVLASSASALARALPTPQSRRAFLRYLAGRYGPLNVTWELAASFENDPGARALLEDTGKALKDIDTYTHPRTTGAQMTSAPLLDDGWMDFAQYGTSDIAVGAIEHQLYQVPAVSAGAEDADPAAFRRSLWGATMNGQYAGCRASSPAARKAMTVWFDFMSATRHWDLEPYFDLDGGRALALPDVEYIVYVDKPGPVELTVEHHGYEVYWLDPSDGTVSARRKFSGDHFTGEPPDRYHDWVLHVVREGELASMNRSYYFESRDVPVQEIQINPEKVPFDIAQPSADLTVGKPVAFEAKLKHASRGTRDMLWMWTGEVADGHQGYRILATGASGTFRPPPGLASEYPEILLVRLYGINGYGTVYMAPKGFALNP